MAELFAFCELHVSRWHARRQLMMNRMADGMLDPLRQLLIPQYYDRKGFPIPGEPDASSIEPGWMLPTLVWARMMQDYDYRVVALDDLPDHSYLSTVWLGLDHSHGLSPPTIFETMRFAGEISEFELPAPFGGSTQQYHESMEFRDPETGEMTEQLRYATEEEAAAAHHEIVRRLRIREGH